jgi:hypothetical protein
MYKPEYEMSFCDYCGDQLSYVQKYPDIKGCDLCPECEAEMDEEENRIEWR